MKRPNLRLKNRKGAFAIMTAVGFFAMMTVGATAVDFSRLWTLRNELQTSADAAAMAGAIELMPARFARFGSSGVIDTVRVYGQRNISMGRQPSVDSIVLGNWNQSSSVFTDGGTPQNAVRVVTSYQMTGLIMTAFGVPAPRMKARATGWAEAPTFTTGCMKPWAVPYEVLMFAINNYRGIANNNTSMNRPFDQVNDMAALNSMTDSARTFKLKLADNGNQSQQNPVTQAGASNTTMPGNYQSVRLGKYWDSATRQYPSPGPQTGGNWYRDWIDGTDQSGNVLCANLNVGDSLQTETGQKIGPTLQALEPAVCTSIIGGNKNASVYGDCMNAQGTVGVDIKASFFRCGSGCNGQSVVGVEMLGSFTLKKVYPQGDGGQNPRWDMAEIVGVFKPTQSTGPVGGGSSTNVRPVLAR